jgi:hypothetical protein
VYRGVLYRSHTIRRWAGAGRTGGFAALVPAGARVSGRTPAVVLEGAVAVKG